ncbi:hypothetical protein BpHYR1_006453 [Brachionus plicatilis]|uniref:Uncharacterized protein n=1 Tax=Brachionus plicatilis TaxID=10195 RepID=A0A3M7Q0G7_BRAPC|nr:hypothetical protein BpHYR1_006453 [Brachionus plicatilis]
MPIENPSLFVTKVEINLKFLLLVKVPFEQLTITRAGKKLLSLNEYLVLINSWTHINFAIFKLVLCNATINMKKRILVDASQGGRF